MNNILEKCWWDIGKQQETGLRYLETFRVVFRIFFSHDHSASRGQTLNTNLFSQTFQATPGFPAKSRTSCPKVCPNGPKIEKNQDLEIFKRDWKFQASHPPDPYFWGEFWRSILKFSIKIENFNRDWKFQARFNFFNLWALLVFSLGFEGALHAEDPHPTKEYPDQKVWVWAPFSCLQRCHPKKLV